MPPTGRAEPRRCCPDRTMKMVSAARRLFCVQGEHLADTEAQEVATHNDRYVNPTKSHYLSFPLSIPLVHRERLRHPSGPFQQQGWSLYLRTRRSTQTCSWRQAETSGDPTSRVFHMQYLVEGRDLEARCLPDGVLSYGGAAICHCCSGFRRCRSCCFVARCVPSHSFRRNDIRRRLVAKSAAALL